MRVVSSNSDADLDRRKAEELVEEALRELACNIMRVSRGAGRPAALGPEAAAFVRALQAHYDTTGCFPDAEVLAGAIAIARRPFIEGQYHDMMAQADAVVCGSLQIAASRLAGQRTQERAGESEMYRGVNGIIAAREVERKRWTQTPLKARSQRKAKSKPAKK